MAITWRSWSEFKFKGKLAANGLLTNSITPMVSRDSAECVLLRGTGGHYHAIQGYDSGSCGIYLAEDMIKVLEVMKMDSYFRVNYLNTTTFFTGAGILPVCTTFPESAPDMTSTIFFLFSSSFSVRSNSVVVRLNVWKSSSSAPVVCPVPRSAAGSVTTRK